MNGSIEAEAMNWNHGDLTPEEQKRLKYLTRVAAILKMSPEELIKECDVVMKTCWVLSDSTLPSKPDENLPYIPLAHR